MKKLIKKYEAWRDMGLRTCILVNVRSEGSTYTKTGAMMLINERREALGLISGGCLEAELMRTGLEAIENGRAMLRTYDMLDEADDFWGSGSGCRGLIDVLLIPSTARGGNGYLPEMVSSNKERREAYFTVASGPDQERLGMTFSAAEVAADSDVGTAHMQGLARDCSAAAETKPSGMAEAGDELIFVYRHTPPFSLLVLGGGPDAVPITEIAALLEWQTTIVDHRPDYISRLHFPQADALKHLPDNNLAESIDLEAYRAAIVKSHHFNTDKRYIKDLLSSSIPYIGLLGPRHRRDKLLGELGTSYEKVSGRLHSPAGIKIKSYDPGSIAMSLIAEIQLTFFGADSSHETGRN